MDIGKTITASWSITIKHLLVILGASLVGGLLSVVSAGILFPPMAAGVMMMYLRAHRGKPIDVPNVFDELRHFFSLFFAFLWRLILVSIGLMLVVIPGLIFAAWWIFTPLFIADQNCGISEAMRRSKKLAKKIGTLNVIVFMFILAVIALSGKLLFGVGLLFTVPLALGTLAIAYAEASGRKKR